MFLLDADRLSLVLHHPGQQLHLEERIIQTPAGQLWASTVVISEMMEGALAMIRRPRYRGQELVGHRLVSTIVQGASRFQILTYDEPADRIFRSFPPKVRRIGQRDCMLAAQAIELNYTVITHNLADFTRIPDVQTADWTHNQA